MWQEGITEKGPKGIIKGRRRRRGGGGVPNQKGTRKGEVQRPENKVDSGYLGDPAGRSDNRGWSGREQSTANVKESERREEGDGSGEEWERGEVRIHTMEQGGERHENG